MTDEARLTGQAQEAIWALLSGMPPDQAPAQTAPIYEGLLSLVLQLIATCCADAQGLQQTSPEDGMASLQDFSVWHVPPKTGAWPCLLRWLQQRPDGHLLLTPEHHASLVGLRVSDAGVQQAVRALLWVDGTLLPYATFSVAVLGSVYEALLGFDVLHAQTDSIRLRPQGRGVALDALLAVAPEQRRRWLRQQADCTLSRAEGRAIQQAVDRAGLVAALRRKQPRTGPGLIAAGSLYLQPGAGRRRSGSHYTPPSITRALVQATLTPLVERFGDHPSPAQILSLRVCDPAMGAGAFLIEACRQLAHHLEQAWAWHGGPTGGQDMASPPAQMARRQVAHRCLYGVDLNPVAVALARTSLWLFTGAQPETGPVLARNLRRGDALVGLSRGQIDAFSWTEASTQARPRASRLRGDLCIAAFWGVTGAKARAQARRTHLALAAHDAQAVVAALRSGDPPVLPFHWEVALPDVFSRPDPGFDAVIGNPPFLNAIGAATGRTTEAAGYFKQVFPIFAQGAYDGCLLFWARLEQLLRRGGRYGMLSPTVLLSSMKPWQRWMHTHMRPDTFLLLPVDQFDAARIRTVGIAGGRGQAAAYRVDNQDDPRPTASFARPWGAFVSNWYEATRADSVQLSASPVPLRPLSTLADISAGCATGTAYALQPLITDQRNGTGLKLITTGAIDRYTSKWGAMTIRYLKKDYTHPRWPAEPGVPAAVRRVRDAQAGPSILMGGLTAVLEAWLDEDGGSAGIVQTWVVVPRELETAYALLGLLNSATFTRVFMQKFGGGAMSGAQTTIKKRALEQSPIPAVQGAALDGDISSLFLHADNPQVLSAATLSAALARVAAVMQTQPAPSVATQLDYLGHILAGILFGRTRQQADEDYRYWAARDRISTPFDGTLESILHHPGVAQVLQNTPGTFPRRRE